MMPKKDDTSSLNRMHIIPPKDTQLCPQNCGVMRIVDVVSMPDAVLLNP